MSAKQSTNHILMVEPASFFANPETMETNVYQVTGTQPHDETFEQALSEVRRFRDLLVSHGVIVTTVKGFAQCPDMVFPNGMSTHRDDESGVLYIYPMLNENRQAERDPAVIDMLEQSYAMTRDWTGFEAQGRALESTASIVMDRVNRIGYAGLSPRSDEDLVRGWCDEMGYEAVIFNTQSHAGKPVYHTDCVMWVGSTLAGVCGENIVDADRARVIERLKQKRDVVEFSAAQLKAMCGNALEVIGADGHRFVAMSSAAHDALSDEQKSQILDHFKTILHSDLSTLEAYGGGSARCLLMELF